MVTKQDVFAFLKEMGITKTDTVLVHSSMRSLGVVEGGCDGLIDAFKAYLSEGLFVVPSHTWDRVNKDNPLFDVQKTMPCTGALCTVAVGRSDGVRSLHPTHSVVAFGKRAEEFVKGEETATTPTPHGGVWDRLYDEHAKILLIGIGHERNTYFHAVDERLDLPDCLVDAPFDVTIIDKDGRTYQTSLYAHKGKRSEQFPNYKRALEYFGAVRYGKLGNALVYCCDAVKCTKVLELLWEKADYNLCAELKEIPESYYKEERENLYADL